MIERPLAPIPTLARALRRASRAILVFGGLGIAMGAFLASPHFGSFMAADRAPKALRAMAGERPAHPAAAGFAELARNVKPAVIAIVARAAEPDPARPHGLPEGQKARLVTSQGSGFFISADGYAVTSNHVIKGSVSIEVHTDNGEVYKARMVGADAISDLAVIKVDGHRDFAHVKFADQPPEVGDWVIAVGNPFGLGGTVTAGIVSARGRDVERESDSYEDLLQIDAPINKGNSGGPTFDIAGEVVGVNTVILSPTGGSIGIAFAIPSDKARQIAGELKANGGVSRAWVGVQFQSVLPEIADSLDLAEAAGIIIADVVPAGPAARAGVVAGDLVDSVNGMAIKNAHDFTRAIDSLPPHTVAILGVRKKGRQGWIAVTLGEAPAPPREVPLPVASADDSGQGGADQPPARPPLGLKLLALGAPSGSGDRHGVMVIEVEPGGLAAGRGIDPGDLILDVAEEAIGAPEDVERLVDSAKSAGKHSVLMRIRSGDVAKFIALPTG